MRILNKSIAVALVIAMIMSAISIGVFADGLGLNLSLASSATSVVGGNTVTVTMQGKTPSGTVGVGAAGIKIIYDTSKFELVTDGISFAPFDAANSEAADNYILLNSFGLNKTFDTNVSDIISFTFKAKEGASALGDATFSFDEYDGCWGASDSSDITVSAASVTVKVIEETTISSVTSVPVEVTYDSALDDAKALFPATVKGSGQTSTGTPVSDVDVPVTWDFTGFTTVPETMDAVAVTGTLTAGAGIVIEDGVVATANVTYTKSTEGVVAPLSVNVMKVEDGKELTAAEVVALPEVAALTNTTIKTANGAEEKISIDLSTAAYVGDVKVNTSLDKGSATLEASVTGTPVFYDITGKKVTITVNMLPAEVKDCKISVSGTTANSKPVVTVTIPASAGIVAGKKIVVKLAPEAALTAEVGGTAEYTITDADVTAMGDAETFTKKIQFDKTVKSMGFATGDKLAFSVEYDGAKLLTEAGEEVVNTKVQATSNPTGGGTITPAPSTSYTVKVAETTNGTASVSASSAMSGETVTVTAVPAEGYVVKDIKVADALGNAVEVKDGAFVMPAANVVVTVEFAEKTEEPTDKPTEETTFADVPAGHWAAEAIDYLKSVGAVNGKTETEFDPDGSVTRAEFTKMLVSLIDAEAAATGVEFADCPADAWYTPYVAKAVAMGLVNGVSDTEFAPNSTISREDVCTIIGRFLNITAEIEDKELTFTDAADVAEYAARYVAYMAELGIVNGYADGSFGPKASITRAESAKVLYGLSKVLAAKTEVVEETTEEVVEEVAE